MFVWFAVSAAARCCACFVAVCYCFVFYIYELEICICFNSVLAIVPNKTFELAKYCRYD